VHEDKEMKGELFGVENLFQYCSGSILKDLRAKYSSNIPIKKKQQKNDLLDLDIVDNLAIAEAVAKAVNNHENSQDEQNKNFNAKNPENKSFDVLRNIGINSQVKSE
jgi:hypothetical protein